MDKHKTRRPQATTGAALPPNAQVPMNRCNLPASIIGSLSFQHDPRPIYIDGVQEMHRQLFTELDGIAKNEQRALHFMDYMTVRFRFEHPEDTGLDTHSRGRRRDKADYLRLLRGWLFDPNGQEAAVMKSWVESRFGLLTRFHKGPLYTDVETGTKSSHYADYLQSRARGLYATNALESQMDLLYSYCQYELARTCQPTQRLHLYRGIDRLQEYEVLQQTDRHHAILLLNNLNSFSRNRERADEFGEQILEVDTCWQKILFYSGLLPGLLIGEEEVILIGGVYAVTITR
jgi:NAD+--dinitrogen-reductase ADP-D-ribosyltransferase